MCEKWLLAFKSYHELATTKIATTTTTAAVAAAAQQIKCMFTVTHPQLILLVCYAPNARRKRETLMSNVRSRPIFAMTNDERKANRRLY